ncbi:MAG: hypothetical protein J6K41_12940 [Paraprevotella sp.]|nr:hypothetical protein [Paraprevotella sp.]
MKTTIKKAITVMLMLTGSIISYGQVQMYEPTPIPLVKYKQTIHKGEIDHKPNRSPSNQTYSIPYLQYDAQSGSLLFESQSDIFITYEIKDATDYSCIEGELNLIKGKQQRLNISYLDEGEYAIYININGITYVGYFEVTLE